tara:strand:+ start:1833 stop:2096 length:264 start_codon:yes stop_codon:yes gene_type:complete
MVTYMNNTTTKSTRRPTEAAFKKKIESMVLRSNPGATIGAWTFFSTGFDWADGSKGVSGSVSVTQDGYRPSEMFGTWGSNGMGWSVR